MNEQLNTWGLYQWFEEHGNSLVHPDDLDTLRNLAPNGKVFQLVAEDGDFIKLRYADKYIRVKPSLFKQVPTPAFQFDEPVSFLKDQKNVTGKITDISWHFQKAQPIFLLEANGKRPTKQYYAADLKRVAG